MDAKTVAMILCAAALIAMFLGWNKAAPATAVSIAPAVTLAPSVATISSTWMPNALGGLQGYAVPTPGPAVAVTAAPVVIPTAVPTYT